MDAVPACDFEAHKAQIAMMSMHTGEEAVGRGAGSRICGLPLHRALAPRHLFCFTFGLREREEEVAWRLEIAGACACDL